MANNENLKPLNQLCKEDAKKIQSKGGKARAKKIQEKKQMREDLIALLSDDIIDKNGKKINTQKAMLMSSIKQALNGNIKALEFIRDTIGEKPALKQEITNTTPQIVVANETDLKALEELKNADINKRIS